MELLSAEFDNPLYHTGEQQCFYCEAWVVFAPTVRADPEDYEECSGLAENVNTLPGADQKTNGASCCVGEGDDARYKLVN